MAVDRSVAAVRPAEWLRGWLAARGGGASAREALRAGATAGYSERTCRRACVALDVVVTRRGFGGGAVWSLPSEPGPESEPADDGGLAEEVAAIVDAAMDSTPDRTAMVPTAVNAYGRPVEQVRVAGPAEASHWRAADWRRIDR